VIVFFLNYLSISLLSVTAILFDILLLIQSWKLRHQSCIVCKSYFYMQAIINSTVTEGMTFNKTAAKFGQWADVRANTVYGLGFASDVELTKFQEQFCHIW